MSARKYQIYAECWTYLKSERSERVRHVQHEKYIWYFQAFMYFSGYYVRTVFEKR
jgi:hypothetical protein